MKRLIWLLSFALISCTSISKIAKPTSSAEKKACVVVRQAFDIGSAATRMKVAQVDRCQNKIKAILLEREEKINFKEDLSHSHDHKFSDKILKEAEQTIGSLINEAKPLKPQEVVSVATEAFREAKNGKPFAEKLNLDLQINLQILSQQEEALLGFFAVTQLLQVDPEKILVWDVGGGSQQMVHFKGRKKFTVYESKLGSISFKDYIVRRILRKNVMSPNPMNSYQIKLATEYAKNNAARTVKYNIKDFLREKDVQVIGIGGVHYYSIRNQLDPTGQKDTFTQEELEKLLQSRIGMKDEDFGSNKYVETQVSNIALILGYMKALHIETVKTLNLNMTDGLLMDYKYWAP